MKKNDIEQVRAFIEYIANPVRAREKRLKEGERINGHYMARVAETLSPWSGQAEAALQAFNRLHADEQ